MIMLVMILKMDSQKYTIAYLTFAMFVMFPNPQKILSEQKQQ